jgi:FkbM family methyltransferase
MNILKQYYNLQAFILAKTLKSVFDPLIIRKNTSDIKVFRDIFAKKELMLPIDIEPKIIIDGGAYVGYSSMYYAMTYPNAIIYAIEPNPILYHILVANTKNIQNIKPINAALWNKHTQLQLIDYSCIGDWAYETIESNEGHIRCITIDDILEMTDHKKIDILKLDIEGSEKELFSSNYKWLNYTNIIIIELHDRMRKDCSKMFYKAINKYTWSIYKNNEKIILIQNI